MNSLIIINYLEQLAKCNSKLQNLLAQTAQCLMRKEELSKLENELQQETLMYTMDVYDLESILKQLKFQNQQQCAAQEQMLLLSKYSAEFCVQVQNIDWNSQLHCRLELMQLQCQNEMRELSEEYEEEKERRKALEQRPIVQKALAAEKEVSNIQAKIDSAKERATAYQNTLFEQMEKLNIERNSTIVYLVKGSKEIADKEAELAALERANESQTKDLITQKDELISKMQKHSMKLPVFTKVNELESNHEETNTKLDVTPSTVTKLEAFPLFGNTINANTEVKLKEISFLDLFREWELKKQQQFQQLVTTTAFPGCSSIAPYITMDNSITDQLSTTSNSGPKSILRRPSISESNEGAEISKKRVRFATPERVNSVEDVMPSCHMNFNANANDDATGKYEEIQNDTFIVEENMPLFNGDTETIEIFSTDEVLANDNEKVSSTDASGQKLKKPHFVTAKKLLKKAKLQSSQRQGKVQANAEPVEKKPKFEIQECRIIKPAGTKLPTKFPIVLTPEPQAQTTNITVPLETLQTNQNKLFKTPPKPKERKQQPDYNNFFGDFLKDTSEENSSTDSEAVLKTVKKTNGLINFDKPMRTCEKSKRKFKKPTMDFETFFRETLKNCNDSSAAMQESPTEEQNNLLQFDLNFEEDNGLSNSNYDDLFADQVNTEKDDDLLTFNFSDE